MLHVSSLKGFNIHDFVICMVVLQYDMSVSCHIFHPSMRNSQEWKSLLLKPILRPVFTLGFLFFFFSETFTSYISIIPDVPTCLWFDIQIT